MAEDNVSIQGNIEQGSNFHSFLQDARTHMCHLCGYRAKIRGNLHHHLRRKHKLQLPLYQLTGATTGQDGATGATLTQARGDISLAQSEPAMSLPPPPPMMPPESINDTGMVDGSQPNMVHNHNYGDNTAANQIHMRDMEVLQVAAQQAQAAAYFGAFHY